MYTYNAVISPLIPPRELCTKELRAPREIKIHRRSREDRQEHSRLREAYKRYVLRIQNVFRERRKMRAADMRSQPDSPLSSYRQFNPSENVRSTSRQDTITGSLSFCRHFRDTNIAHDDRFSSERGEIFGYHGNLTCTSRRACRSQNAKAFIYLSQLIHKKFRRTSNIARDSIVAHCRTTDTTHSSDG